MNIESMDCYGDGNVYRGVRSEDSETKTICFKREWVGLTEDDVISLCKQFLKTQGSNLDAIYFARAIEVKLKEKNHVD